MMTLVVGGGTVVTPDGPLEHGHVVVEGDLLAEVGTGRRAGDLDARGGWIVPGFIDLQVNGAHGIDVTSEPERVGELGAALTRYGVTSFLPTVITAPADVRARALAAIAAHAAAPAGGATALGLHFEGPMLSPGRRGAHPAGLIVEPSLDLVDGWSAGDGVALVTLAPERPGAPDVISALAERGVVVAIGHTDATAAEFDAARRAGARYVTHLFNAMRPFGHRDPGPIGATLADDTVVAGLICDGIHVDPVAVRMAWRSLGPARTNLVTDAVGALGLPTGGGTIGSVGVTVGAGGVRNAEGVLAGSVVPLDAAVRNLIAFTGCSVPDAIATVTSTPAAVLGLADRGRLATGARGDVVVLDPELHIVATVAGGEVAWRS